MKRYHSLQIVTNSNGIVRIYGDGGMIFEVQCDYVRAETLVDCGTAAASGTIPKLKESEKPKPRESWVINSFFSFEKDGKIGIYKCVKYSVTRGFLMLGLTEGVRENFHHASELDIGRTHQVAYDMGLYWESKTWPGSTEIKIQKDSQSRSIEKGAGRIAVDASEFEPMSAEEKYRRDNWEMQPEARWLQLMKNQ